MNVLVDDDDPLIRYIQYDPPSGWANYGPLSQFNGTTHVSATPGDTATLQFTGNSISLYGSIQPSNIGSKLNFSIDGMAAGSVVGVEIPSIIHNQLFWASSILEEALHTLVVTVDHHTMRPDPNLLNRTFFLDYFIYNTAATTVMALETKRLIDDGDSNVIYSEYGWKAGTNSDGSLKGTLHSSESQGAWTAVEFQGTDISVFGTAQGTASFTIDSSPSVTLPKSQGQLFESNGLHAGSHILNITSVDGSLEIDYFLVTPPVGNGTTMSQSPAHPTSTAVTHTAPSSAPVTPTSSTSQLSKTAHLPTVIGGTMSGVVLLGLVLAFVLIRRRRMRTRTNGTQSLTSRWLRCQEDPESTIAPQPFRSSVSDESTENPPPPYTAKYFSRARRIPVS
ncbi:hypothetical protein R3P38DRAFT_1299598 [Favolaschia claudopus]|uniref:Transmembrane protein n=1 Tax=Favolaschia claudopus TaxID=2862362 RepID=A0AAW0AXW8_9AGAR